MSSSNPSGSIPDNPTIYNTTMTVADTQYSQQLTKYTKKFLIHTRDESEFRLAFVTGIVAVPGSPYVTVLSGTRYYEDGVLLRVQDADWDGTLYFASDSAGKIIEILEWV